MRVRKVAGASVAWWSDGGDAPVESTEDCGRPRIHSASISGRWKAKTSRARGSGSSALVKCVSAPVLS